MITANLLQRPYRSTSPFSPYPSCLFSGTVLDENRDGFSFSFSLLVRCDIVDGLFLRLILFLVRILGGTLQIAAQLVRPVNTNLYLSAAILEAAGLSPLLLATLGFVQTVYVV